MDITAFIMPAVTFAVDEFWIASLTFVTNSVSDGFSNFCACDLLVDQTKLL